MSVDLKARLKGLLPRGLAHAVGDFRNVSPAARLTYLRLWVFRALRIQREAFRDMDFKIRSVLIVCYGNIIRSPVAAALVKKYLADLRCTSISVRSAGTCVQPGRGADERALLVSRECGISLESHRAQPLTSALVEGSDLILVMDHRNEAELLARYPKAKNKVFMLGGIQAECFSQCAEIPDPYAGTAEDVRQCYETLKSCAQRLAVALSTAMDEHPERSLGFASPKSPRV